MEEIWRDIEGYGGLYQVSNLGRIMSLERMISSDRAADFKRKMMILKHSLRSGYPIVTISKDSVRTCFKIHRLVAQAFIPNPDNKPQVNHKNGIKTDNRAENLEWCTIKENIQHAEETGLRPNHAKGDRIGISALTDGIVLEMRKLKNSGVSYRELSAIYGVCPATIRHACIGLTWKHLDKSTVFKAYGRKGEETGVSKLNNKMVREIRENYDGSLTHDQIAKQYGVSRRTIGRLLKRQIWTHV